MTVSSFLPAVQLLYFKVRVEVEHNPLRTFWRGDDPAAILMGGILQRVAGGGDVACVCGIQVAATCLRTCAGKRQAEGITHTSRQKWGVGSL